MPPLEYALSKLFACAQLAAFLALPELVLKPHWNAILGLFGGDAARANILGVPLLHLAVLLSFNLLFLFVYALHSPFFEKYRISRKPWAWRPEASKEEREGFWPLAAVGAAATLFNIALTVPLSAGNFDLAVKLGHSAALEDFPPTWKIAARILLFMVVEDFMFYWSHRTLHAVPFLYRNVHKFHHRWRQSTSLAAESTHPVEFVLGNVIPFAAGPLLAGAHLSELYLWTLWRIGETVTNHSGYDFPWSVWSILPFQGSAFAHDAHHALNVNGNFASFFMWNDRFWGTEVPESQSGPKPSEVPRAAEEEGEAGAAGPEAAVAGGDGGEKKKRR
jgi:sterol desaturase/sphingolipid hydroxylase (fatty acid hydroxylase superfamily)